jgi:manganese/zinc/iron transport system permease protein
MTAFWIILAGALVAVSCGLLGCYLILRKMAMVGDAISHAVLPGIVIAYLLSGTRESFAMLIGAIAIGLFSTVMIEFLHRTAKLQTDASIGVTFTWLFAAGIIMLSLFAGQVDLDQECVLYGEIAYVPLDLMTVVSGIEMPRVTLVMSVVLVIIITFITLSYKELLLTTFDPHYAAAIGISTLVWHYLLMGLVSLTTVAAFEAVGAILVVAFLIAPAATAYLLTNDFRKMLWISALVGVLASIGGYYLAWWLDGSIAGAMASVCGFFFLLAFFFSPTNGVLVKRLRVGKG